MVAQLLEWFSGLSVSRVYALRIVTLVYAAVFAVEGHRLVDGKALGGVADHHHYRLADTARGLGNFLPADDRQGV